MNYLKETLISFADYEYSDDDDFIDYEHYDPDDEYDE